LETFTPPTDKNTEADFFSRWRNRQMKTVLLVVSRPSFATKAGVVVSPTFPLSLSGGLFPKYSHLHTKFFYRQQVSRMAPPTVPRFFPTCIGHLTLTSLTPMLLLS
jgi:hypothetical protein